MNDKYYIDNHKLIFHPKKVCRWLDSYDSWLKAKKIYPIYLEISPVGFCNHRCKFCALDFMGYKYNKIEFALLKKLIGEMSTMGIKSIMFAGEGEPLLYKELPEILTYCKQVGIDTAITTNLVPLVKKHTSIILENCKWIKISINAGTSKNYAFIHGTNENDFYKVIENMRYCVEIKNKNKFGCTLGAQILLLDDNYNTTLDLVKLVKEIGFSYIVIKPYSQHLSSLTTKYKEIDYSKYLFLEKELEQFNTDNFEVIFRTNTINKLIFNQNKYNRCYSVPFFWSYITSSGDVYSCSAFIGNEKFNLGNINNKSFKDIWEGKKRKENYTYIKEEHDINFCRINCRMDEINRYLWKLINPIEHVNFI